jgi:hypothetical protein
MQADYLEMREYVQDMDQDGFKNTLYEGTDCDDGNKDIHPGATELCDLVDNDCDERVDEEAVDAQKWYADGDDDGYGNPALALTECTAPTGFVDNDEDCNDADPEQNPESIWYADADEDGYGSTDYSITQCELPPGYSSKDGDCDDGNTAVYPTAEEICDGLDNNCDGIVDTDAIDKQTWYPDNDMDGYGSENQGQTACEGPDGWILTGGDCNDSFDDQHPGAEEICRDRRDNDCDGTESGCLAEGEIRILEAEATRMVGGSNSGQLGAFLIEVSDIRATGWTNIAVGAPLRLGGTAIVYTSGIGSGTLGDGNGRQFIAGSESVNALGTSISGIVGSRRRRIPRIGDRRANRRSTV